MCLQPVLCRQAEDMSTCPQKRACKDSVHISTHTRLLQNNTLKQKPYKNKCTTLSGHEQRRVYTPLHMYSTYTTTINNLAPLSAGMQQCLLTDKQSSPFYHHYWSHPRHTRTVEAQQPDKQGSPPLLHFHWSRPLQLQIPHTAEARFGLGMVSLLHRLGSVPVGHPQNGNGHLLTPL